VLYDGVEEGCYSDCGYRAAVYYVLTTDVDSWRLLLFERAGSFAYFGDGYVINHFTKCFGVM